MADWGAIYQKGLVDPANVRIFRSERGGLVVRLGDEEYQELIIRRAFPLEPGNRHIGFAQPDGTELGLLEDADALDQESRELLLEELGKVYFRPVIQSISNLGEELGVVQADVETTSGPRQIEIRQIRRNIRLLSGNRALIEDVDGNRYELRDRHLLPRVTREILGL